MNCLIQIIPKHAAEYKITPMFENDLLFFRNLAFNYLFLMDD